MACPAAVVAEYGTEEDGCFSLWRSSEWPAHRVGLGESPQSVTVLLKAVDLPRHPNLCVLLIPAC